MMNRCRRMILLAAGVLLVAQPASLLACSACYGAPDSPMSKGLIWSIGVLLGVVGMVLSGIAGFFVYLAKKPPVMPGENLKGSSDNEKAER